MKFSDLKIGWRLGTAFGGIVLMLACIVAIQAYALVHLFLGATP